ncbi:MAG: NGG1p interacting factor NIF3 [Candidatus Omnitrophica bacterium]|nr:NGG1p interacting factor NIF3 [Candidatus Omnitrophota bacterium]
MNLKQFYESAVQFGLKNDFRSTKEIKADLSRVEKDYKQLKGVAKKLFDKERMKHPYADTRILNGELTKKIKTILVGIDMEVPEILLADRLNEKGLVIDLVLAHHPEGKALSKLGEVMHLQKNGLEKFGIKKEMAVSLMDDRIAEVSRSLLTVNHTRAVDAAKLLNMTYMCVHTPADNHVNTYLTRLFAKKKPKKVKDVLNILYQIPEYQQAALIGAGPTQISGKPDDDAGKIMIEMTGGTEGSKKVFARLSQAGVQTIIGMHFSETHYTNAKEEKINLIIAGHISSDNLGLNLLFDNIEKKHGSLNILGCSGFKRVKRK